MIINSPAADFIVSQPGFADIIVELKGRDVDHAMLQIEATAAHWERCGYRTGKLGAIVVARQFPRANTAVRKAQQRFAAAYKSPLHVVTKNYEGNLDWVLNFSGPYR